MSVEVADGAVPLAEDRNVRPAPLSALQTRGEVRAFLAERRGTCALTVRAGRHRRVRVTVGELGELPDAGVERLLQQRARAGEQTRVAHVVDVLGSAGEVHQLQGRRRRAGLLERPAHVVLDRLHVVVDARFDCLHRLRGTRIVGAGEFCGTGTHRRAQRSAGQLRRRCRQVQQPLRFDADALTDEPGLGQEAAQGRGRRAVAAVDRCQRVQRRKWLVG